jgi:hypothetical protein
VGFDPAAPAEKFLDVEGPTGPGPSPTATHAPKPHSTEEPIEDLRRRVALAAFPRPRSGELTDRDLATDSFCNWILYTASEGYARRFALAMAPKPNDLSDVLEAVGGLLKIIAHRNGEGIGHRISAEELSANSGFKTLSELGKGIALSAVEHLQVQDAEGAWGLKQRGEKS